MKNELVGGLIMLIILILIEMLDIIRVMMNMVFKNNILKNRIYWIMNIMIPPLNSKRLISILMNKSSKKLCQLIENDENIRSKIGSFKEINENDLIKHLLIILIEIVLIFVILCLIDLKYFSKKVFYEKEENEFDENDLDEDVLNERIHLLSNNYSFDDPFIAFDIVKKYPSKESLAINHLTFSIEQGQCFGLLGFNGAGISSSLLFFSLLIVFVKVKHHCTK